MEEVVNAINYERYIKEYNPIMEELANGEKAVKYYSLDDPIIGDTPRDHIWSYINWNGVDNILPGLRITEASWFIITSKPWGIGDSGLVVSM